MDACCNDTSNCIRAVLAIIVNHPVVKGKKFIRTVLILPWAVPSFVTILIFVALFNDEFGAINNDILQPLLGVAQRWLSDPFWAKVALIGIQVWLGFICLCTVHWCTAKYFIRLVRSSRYGWCV